MAASTGPNAAADACRPLASNCGRQKRGWFGSLPTMNVLTDGYVRATWPAHAANALGVAAVSP